ncbi:MAG: hypothetical protein P1R58_05120 [bacterium]|nr:hypothetical protein [bacterium]
MTDFSFQFTVDADLDNRVMYAKIFGVWRVDTAQSYHEAFKEEAQEMIGQEWGKLVDLSNWRMGTPEVIDKIGEHMKWCMENKMVCQVYVITDPVRYNQLQKMFEKGKAKAKSATFRTRSEAERFLVKQGFKIR